MKNMAVESGGLLVVKAALAGLALAGMLSAAMALPSGAAFADQRGLAAMRVSEVGTTFAVGGNTYRVTDAYEGPHDLGEVTLVRYGSSKKAPSFNVVKHGGKAYEVEEIGKNAFNNAKGHKITSVKLGKHVDKIKAKAFYGCSKLKLIDISKSDVIDIDRSKKTGEYYLDDLNVGKQAFSKAGTSTVKVRCGNANASYQSIVKKALVGKGLNKNATVVR